MEQVKDATTEWLCPGCCWTHTNYIVPIIRGDFPKLNGPRIRAGVFLYNPLANKILIVQAYNEFTGIPKGGQEENESLPTTALRELKEETGVELTSVNENDKVVMYNTCTYYMVQTDVCYPVKLHKFDGNDVTGVGWVHPECISKLPGRVTSHFEKLLKIYNKRIHAGETSL